MAWIRSRWKRGITGHAIADFLLGRLDSFDQGTGEYKNNRATYAALFFQDDFKVSRRLTLNLGVRYEPTPPWHEVRGRIQFFSVEGFHQGVKSSQFRNAPPGVFFRGDPGVPEDGTLGDYNNLAGRFPRTGRSRAAASTRRAATRITMSRTVAPSSHCHTGWIDEGVGPEVSGQVR